MCAAGLQQAVQAPVNALLVISTSRRAVFVMIALQHGDHIVVTKVHRLIHWRVPPSAQRKQWHVKKILHEKYKCVTWTPRTNKRFILQLITGEPWDGRPDMWTLNLGRKKAGEEESGDSPVSGNWVHLASLQEEAHHLCVSWEQMLERQSIHVTYLI